MMGAFVVYAVSLNFSPHRWPKWKVVLLLECQMYTNLD